MQLPLANAVPGLCLVFPKPFEFVKFLTQLVEEDAFLVLDIIHPYGELEYCLFVQHVESSKCYCFRVLLIGDSDINFYGILSKLMARSSNRYLLMGSCGSSDFADLEEYTVAINKETGGKRLCDADAQVSPEEEKKVFGHMFVVEKAFKGDRGYLDLSSTFRLKEDKVSSRMQQMFPADRHALEALVQPPVQKRQACSTNFMNENTIAPQFSKSTLFDMETFDFFDLCSKVLRMLHRL